MDKIGISFVKSVGDFAHFLVTSPTVFLPQLQVVCWTLQAGDICSTWCRERLLFCPGYPRYPWSGQFVLGPLLLGIKSSCWCVTSKGVERETGCCFWEVDQGVIVALGGWLKDCWVGSPKCGVGRRGGTACGGGGSNYLSKQYTLFSWHQLRKALIIYKWTFFPVIIIHNIPIFSNSFVQMNYWWWVWPSQGEHLNPWFSFPFCLIDCEKSWIPTALLQSLIRAT